MPEEPQAAPANQPAVPPHEADLQERLKNFSAELQPLLGKYELGIGAQAGLTPDGRVHASPILVSTRKNPNEKPNESKPAGLTEA